MANRQSVKQDLKEGRDKNTPTGDMLGNGTPKWEGLCASEILRPAPCHAGYSGAHLECFCTDAPSMRDKQEELEASAPSQNKRDLVCCDARLWALQEG